MVSDVRGERGTAGRTADGCARRGRTRRRRPPRPTVCGVAGTAARRRLRLARRPPLVKSPSTTTSGRSRNWCGATRCTGCRTFPANRRTWCRSGPDLALELKTLMAARGFYQGEPDGNWDPEAQAATGPLPGQRELRQPDRQRRAVRSGGPRRPTPAIRTTSPSADELLGVPTSCWTPQAGTDVQCGECEVAMCRWMAYSGDPVLGRGAAVPAGALDHRPEPARQARRVHHER